MEFIEAYWFETTVAVVALILFLYNFTLSRKLKAYKKMATLLKGGSLEEHICKLEEGSKIQTQQIQDLQQQLKALREEIAAYPHCWHLLRYNAFAKTGSDLSFSLALLNENAEGFVLTSIFGREDSRVYAKPVQGGESKYSLSEEEVEAITVAMDKRSR